MSKRFIIAFLAAIAFGYLLVNPWAFFIYAGLLIITTAFAVIVIVMSLVNKTKIWKTTLLYLVIAFTPLPSSFIFMSYISYQIDKQKKEVISALYSFHDKHGNFPPAVPSFVSLASYLRPTYSIDTDLNNFTLHIKGLYGFPQRFSSRDSTWKY